jgi:hypothetical protein
MLLNCFYIGSMLDLFLFLCQMLGSTYPDGSIRKILCQALDNQTVCLVNCCWPLPAQSFFVPSPMGLMTVFYCHDSGSDATPLGQPNSSPVNCCWTWPAQSFLVLSAVGIYDLIYVPSKTVYEFGNGVVSLTRRGVSLSKKSPHLLHRTFAWTT